MTRHGKVAGNDLVRRHFPLVADAASVIGDVQIRNRGTIGGSLVHADPAGDYLAPAVVLGAEFTLVSSKGSRTLAAGDFVVDIMRSGAGPTEILTEISIPKLPDGARTAYARLVRVEGNFAIVTAAAVVAGDTAKVAIGGATSRPVLIEQPAEPLRAGGAPAYAALGDAAYEACADAFGDMTSASEYRREMTRVYAQRSVRAALNPDEKRR
jgi:carbon-monoxide dehydrogenase medium subunit